MPVPDPEGVVRAALKSQYHAALAMLRQAIELCPEAAWAARDHRNAPWQIAYHTLFFAHLYLQVDEHGFRPWKHHEADVQVPDGIPGPPDPGSPLPLIADPYPKERVLEYCAFCDAMVDGAVEATDVFAPESGFSWYPIPKLEHQLVNVRHIQHGAAQLADRVRAAADAGVDWVGARRGA
ncbi:hypothetical protein K8I85_11820 [bacterium]|nr:hypothetical protein [bacterium]